MLDDNDDSRLLQTLKLVMKFWKSLRIKVCWVRTKGNYTRILALTGLRRAGWGIVDYDGSNIRHVAHGTITPSHKLELVERFVVLHQDLLKIVEDFRPVTAAAEETFVNQNGASTLKLEGVLLSAALQ